jgi:hypothetical protein
MRFEPSRSDAEGHALSANQQISFEGIQRFLKSVFGQDLHAKRILSLAGATLASFPASRHT